LEASLECPNTSDSASAAIQKCLLRDSNDSDELSTKLPTVELGHLRLSASDLNTKAQRTRRRTKGSSRPSALRCFFVFLVPLCQELRSISKGFIQSDETLDSDRKLGKLNGRLGTRLWRVRRLSAFDFCFLWRG